MDEFPWIVSLHDLALTLNGHPVFFCTGALLDPTHVLTAAHCLDAGREEVVVILASNNKEDLHPQHVAVNVAKIDSHPSYKEDTYMKGYNGSDVAVLTLAAPVQYSHKIKPICLPSNPRQDYGGRDAVAAGFGRGEDDGGNTFSQDEMMKKMVFLIPDEECLSKRVYLQPRVRVHYGYPHNVHILCSHVPGTLSAIRNGDSGSALNLRENGRFVDLQCLLQYNKNSFIM